MSIFNNIEKIDTPVLPYHPENLVRVLENLCQLLYSYRILTKISRYLKSQSFLACLITLNPTPPPSLFLSRKWLKIGILLTKQFLLKVIKKKYDKWRELGTSVLFTFL